VVPEVIIDLPFGFPTQNQNQTLSLQAVLGDRYLELFSKEPYKRDIYSAKDTYNFKEPTTRSHPILGVKYLELFAKEPYKRDIYSAKETYNH